jgi:hypothetical protein
MIHNFSLAYSFVFSSVRLTPLQNTPYDGAMRYRALGHKNNTEVDDPEVDIVLIKNGRKSCFHVAVLWSNDLENAKVVCAQEVLYRTKEDDPDVYFAVYDVCEQMVSFCLCRPSSQEIKDTSQHSVRNEHEKVAERLRTYVASNAEVLS